MGNAAKRLVRPAVILGITVLACVLGWAVSLVSGRADDFFYDAIYRLRPEQDMTKAEVVLVAVDQPSLTAAKKGWPWPRKYWADISTYLDHAGAKAIAFDIVFPEPSIYGDDAAFAEGMNRLKTPVIFGSAVKPGGDWEPFAPDKIEKQTFGVVNLANDKVYRQYTPEKEGQPSLAEITAVTGGADPQGILDHFPGPFLLHYYGPHVRHDGGQTFRFVPAYSVLMAQDDPASRWASVISPELFRGKIVIVCAIALGTFDLKTSPLSDEYPGPEVQATAIENLLHGQQVHTVAPWGVIAVTILCALAVTAGIVYPRRASFKIVTPIVVVIALFAASIMLFRNDAIYWLSPVKPLLAIFIASPLAFGFTYFTEDRQRRFMLKALSKVVSPAVADQLSRDPERLALGTVRTEITVLFTDLANFTDLSEDMDVQDLGKLINRYLGEMSAQVFRQDGTLDKYIGDAVMCFWNAPLPQADHAVRACLAALAMISREKELHAEFAELGTKKIHTRIGINTASAAVGFIGSEHLFNYTAMGDGINLASRMEGANKLYGTQILLTESTASLVRERFYLRRIDVLRVKGKKQPMAVYELLMEKETPDSRLEERIRGYEEAFAAYQNRQWDAAEKLLLELSARFGEDGAVEALAERVRDFRRQPPPAEWDGVYISSSK